MMNKRIIESPIGNLLLRADDSALKELSFTDEKPYSEEKNRVLDLSEKELKEYFRGNLKKFSVNISQSGTEFQERVWKELEKIPYGETISYKELSERAGAGKGYRACGTANGKNHIAIIVPCHRVISHDGSLGGYSGGLDKKRYLLENEGIKVKQK